MSTSTNKSNVARLQGIGAQPCGLARHIQVSRAFFACSRVGIRCCYYVSFLSILSISGYVSRFYCRCQQSQFLPLHEMRRSFSAKLSMLTPTTPFYRRCIQSRALKRLTHHDCLLSKQAQGLSSTNTFDWPAEPESIRQRFQLRKASSVAHADAISEGKEKQARAPWHREGSDMAPVARQRSAGAMTKGMPTHEKHSRRNC